MHQIDDCLIIQLPIFQNTTPLMYHKHGTTFQYGNPKGYNNGNND